MARAGMRELVERITRYAKSSQATSPSSLRRDFMKVVKCVPEKALQRSLAKAITAGKTSSWLEILKQLYEHSSKNVRAQLLNAILEVDPELRNYLDLAGDKVIKSKDSEFTTRKKSTKIAIDVVSHVYAQHPFALRGLSPRVQYTILHGLAPRRREGRARRRQPESNSTYFAEWEPETPFSAFARLSVPELVTAGKLFKFEVGFGSEPDTKANSRAKSKIEVRAKPGEDMLVIVAAENGTILSQPNHARLPLNLDAKAT